MACNFQIESIFKVTGLGLCVAAKYLNPEIPFWLPEFSKLGIVPITSYLSQPRALDNKGNAKLDLWIFQFQNENDIDNLQKGQVVSLFPGDSIKYLEPWVAIDSNGYFEGELYKEISKAHLLYGKTVKAVAKREDRDYVLFQWEEEKFAVVHLTWSGKLETLENFPLTRNFDHWTTVYEQVISRDHLEFKS